MSMTRTKLRYLVSIKEFNSFMARESQKGKRERERERGVLSR